MKRKMQTTDWIHVVAGAFIVGSLALGEFHHHYWRFFTLFVGLSLFQFGFTGFCPMAIILRKLGVKDACDCS